MRHYLTKDGNVFNPDYITNLRRVEKKDGSGTVHWLDQGTKEESIMITKSDFEELRDLLTDPEKGLAFYKKSLDYGNQVQKLHIEAYGLMEGADAAPKNEPVNVG